MVSMNSPSLALRIFGGTLAFSVVGSIITRYGHVDPGPVAALSSLVLILSGAWLILRELTGPTAAGLLFFAAGAEIVGVQTGWVFGAYHYTDAWWPTISLPGGEHFPMLVPFAWTFIVGACAASTRNLSGRPARALAAALLAAAIDWPMERAMTGVLGYWRWDHPTRFFGAPLQNTLGWFVVALIAGVVLVRTEREGGDWEAPLALGLFGSFTALVGWLNGFDAAWPALILLSSLPLILARTLERAKIKAN